MDKKNKQYSAMVLYRHQNWLFVELEEGTLITNLVHCQVYLFGWRLSDFCWCLCIIWSTYGHSWDRVIFSWPPISIK